MRYLDKRHILLLHKQLIDISGGSYEIRDDALLESALNAPFQSFDGADLYPTVLQKAVRLGFGLIRNHPFVDGNKRIGTHAMLIFLDINNISLKYNDDELIEIILKIASSTADEQQLLQWVQEHIE